MAHVAPAPATAAMGALCLNLKARARSVRLRACVAGLSERVPDMMLSAALGPSAEASLRLTLSRAALFRRSGATFAASICARAASLSSLTREVIHATPEAGEGVDAHDAKPLRSKALVDGTAGFGHRVAGVTARSDASSDAAARLDGADDAIFAATSVSAHDARDARKGHGRF